MHWRRETTGSWGSGGIGVMALQHSLLGRSTTSEHGKSWLFPRFQDGGHNPLVEFENLLEWFPCAQQANGTVHVYTSELSPANRPLDLLMFQFRFMFSQGSNTVEGQQKPAPLRNHLLVLMGKSPLQGFVGHVHWLQVSIVYLQALPPGF